MSEIAVQTFDAAENEVQVVDARWVGTYEAQLPDTTVLVPGETTVQIPLPEALASGNWEVLDSISDLKKAAKKLGAKVPTDATKAAVETIVHDGIVAALRKAAPTAEDEPEPESSEPGEAQPSDEGAAEEND